MKIVITGSSGFVGKNLKSALISGGYEISPLFLRNTKWKIPKKSDIVIHLAGIEKDTLDVNNINDYFIVNTNLTENVFKCFLTSDSKVFIFFSTVKAVKDFSVDPVVEETLSTPVSVYGKSKQAAENLLLKYNLPANKKLIILRPCIIHGPHDQGNLKLLYSLIRKGIPWPLAAFDNKRSFCSIDNLCFIIKELIEREDIPSGIYNVADDETVSTNELIKWMAEAQGKKPILLPIPKCLIQTLARIGDKLRLPLNSERLQKLTENYVVSNEKIKKVLAKPFPLTTKEGFMKTFQSFNQAQ